jgi:hypothetical protein
MTVVKVVGSAKCSSVTVEADYWIPLKVTWNVERRTGVLYLFVSGEDGGYVELKADEHTGALLQFVVVEAPPVSTEHSWVAELAEEGTPLLDTAMWDWRITPDYAEPAGREISVVQRMSMSMGDRMLLVAVSDRPPSYFIGSAEARVGITDDGEMVCLVARNPQRDVPVGYPLARAPQRH